MPILRIKNLTDQVVVFDTNVYNVGPKQQKDFEVTVVMQEKLRPKLVRMQDAGLIEFDHINIEGDSDDDAEFVTLADLNDKIGSSGGGGGATIFVLRPGGVPDGNIYTDWPTLYADYSLTDGPATIEFDDSLGAITIPAGAYAFREDTTLEGVLRQNPALGGGDVGTLVELADGVTFDPPPIYYRNGIWLRSLSSSPIISVTPTGGPSEFLIQLLERGAVFEASGGSPFVESTRLSTEGGVFFFLVLGGRFNASTDPVLNLLGDVPGGIPAIAQLNMLSSGQVRPDTIEGNAQGLLFAQVSDDSNFSILQSGYSFPLPLRESVTVDSTRWLPTTVFDASTIGFLAPRPNMTIRCDPLIAGPMSISLPSVSGVQSGDEILIKNVTASPSTITLVPAGSDTIDGAPTLVLSSPRGVVKIQSDGAGDWMVVT